MRDRRGLVPITDTRSERAVARVVAAALKRWAQQLEVTCFGGIRRRHQEEHAAQDAALQTLGATSKSVDAFRAKRHEHWPTQVRSVGSGYWRAIGSVELLISKAETLGLRWLKGIGTARRLQQA